MTQVRAHKRVNWQTSEPLPPRWSLQERSIGSLRLHETPGEWRVDDIVAAMRRGESMPLVSIARDGMVLDGHHRVKAAARVLGEDAVIPVAVHEVW